MEIVNYIIKYLEQYNRVAVPFLGTFLVKNSQAQYNAKTKSFLPPKQEVFFTENIDINDDEFLTYIANQEKKSVEEISFFLEQEIKNWNTQLVSIGEIQLNGLGTFRKKDGKLVFVSSFTPKYMPEDFGLEEIPLKHLKRKFGSKKEKKNSFRKTLFWIILALSIIAALVYLGMEKKDFLLKTTENLINSTIKK